MCIVKHMTIDLDCKHINFPGIIANECGQTYMFHDG